MAAENLNQTPLAEIQRRSLRYTVCRRTEEAIAQGVFEGGDKLNEADLSRSLGVSRGLVREASRDLEASGVLVNVPEARDLLRQAGAAVDEETALCRIPGHIVQWTKRRCASGWSKKRRLSGAAQERSHEAEAWSVIMGTLVWLAAADGQRISGWGSRASAYPFPSAARERGSSVGPTATSSEPPSRGRVGSECSLGGATRGAAPGRGEGVSVLPVECRPRDGG